MLTAAPPRLHTLNARERGTFSRKGRSPFSVLVVRAVSHRASCWHRHCEKTGRQSQAARAIADAQGRPLECGDSWLLCLAAVFRPEPLEGLGGLAGTKESGDKLPHSKGDLSPPRMPTPGDFTFACSKPRDSLRHTTQALRAFGAAGCKSPARVRPPFPVASCRQPVASWDLSTRLAGSTPNK